MNQPACQPEDLQQEQQQQQQPWLGYASGPCDEPDGLLTPTQSCSSQHPDGQASSDDAPFHPATDLSNLLSQYVLNPSSFPSGPFSAPDPSLGPCPTFPHNASNYLAHSPQPSSARPAAVARRATVSSVPSRLPHSNHPAGLLAPDLPIHSPPPLDAAYNLLAGWGSTPSSFSPFFNQSHHQQQLIASPCKDAEFTINNNNGALAEQYMLPSGSHASAANALMQMATHAGPRGGNDGLDSPFSASYSYHPSPCHSEYPSANGDLSVTQLTPHDGLEVQTDPSLLTPSIHTLAHSLTNSNQNSPAFVHFGIPRPQPTEHSPSWNPESYPHYDPPLASAPAVLDQTFMQNWDQPPGANPSLVFLNGGAPFAAMSSSAPSTAHPDPRRVSDPSPVAPVAQRPWDPHHRYSIANLPYHASRGTAEDAQFFDSTALPYDLHAPHTGSSRHSGSVSTTTSHLTSGELPTPSTAGFGDEVCDHWAQLALQNFEDQVASFDNIYLPVNPPHAPVDSPHQKSPSCRSKSSSLDSAHDGPPLPPSGEQANSNLDHDTEKNEAALKTPKKRGRAATLCETTVPSSLLPEPFMSSSRAQFASEYMNAFRQARPLPFSLSPHSNHSNSPHAPVALFPSQVDHSQLYHGPVSFVELLQDSTSENLSLREYHMQQQNRLRRMTTMSQPSWTESNLSGRTLQPSPSSSFRRYHERASCDLGGNPEMSYGQKGSGGLLRKRKSMSNKDYRVDKMTVREELEHDSSGNERGNSDDMSSGILFREVSFKNEDSTSQEGSEPPVGCSQRINSTPPYNPSRFGGIGQGQSAHPPGLSGAVKPSALDLAGFMDETGEMMIPWRQELRCDEDLYTPMWCRGQNDKKEGFCDMCEGGAWFRLKNSAYWYHKQYFHGVSSTTGHYFYPPREIKRGFSTANRQQILGLCHECEQWVGFSSIIGNGTMKKSVPHRNELAGSEGGQGHRPEWLDCDEPGTSKVPTLWYKHAHKCHRHQTCKGAKGRKKAKRT